MKETQMNQNPQDLPKTQHAVQPTGPGELVLNTEKSVTPPQAYEILGRVEATGLCFSDLKLLKQFDKHPRKGRVVSGMDLGELSRIASYVPAQEPTVLGHETVIEIVAIGEKVVNHQVGERCLVQTDYRWLLNDGGGNASFGYNFEGGLQEYVIIDERVSRDFDTGERFLLPVSDKKSASAFCLAEPWACVEDSYLYEERQTILSGSKLLVVADAGRAIEGLAESFAPEGPPAEITFHCADETQREAIQNLSGKTQETQDIASLPDSEFDDIVYFGSDPQTIETLNSKPSDHAIINVVRGASQIGREVAIGIGRIHYGQLRWIGTDSTDASQAYKTISKTGEIRDDERCLVIGAAGPMGQMHVLRNVSLGAENFRLVATDLDESRLENLAEKATPLARENNAKLRIIKSDALSPDELFTNIILLVPVPALLIDSIARSAEGALINVFAGIPAPTIHPVDLDRLIEKNIFLFGTSGSLLSDMKMVLQKVEEDKLDTNLSVDAVSGMAGAIDGMAAVENRTLAGKIIVYPPLHDLPLTPLSELAEKFPSVAALLDNGKWTKAAEEELLRVG